MKIKNSFREIRVRKHKINFLLHLRRPVLKVMPSDLIAYVMIILLTAFILYSSWSSERNILVYITFLVIGIISFIGAVWHTDAISIRRTVNIFSYIFLFMAPWQQYFAGICLWRNNGFDLVFTDSLYIRTNVLIVAALLFFNIFCEVFSKRDAGRNIGKDGLIVSEEAVLSKKNRNILLLMSLLSFAILLFSGKIGGSGLMFANTSINSQVWNMIRFVPVCALIIHGMTCPQWRKAVRYADFIILLAVFLIIFNPFGGYMARYILLGSYIMLLAAWKPEGKRKAWYFLVYFSGFAIFFTSMKSNTALFNFKSGFVHVDYDAHQNLMSIVQYTDRQGMVYGKNIISALAFLIPRSLWHGKMEATGGLFAEYFHSRVTNISAPIWGELYFAFGWLGVILGSVVLARLVTVIDRWHNSPSLLKRGTFCIVCGLTMYLCRGSMLPTMAYTLGLILALWLLSRILVLQKRLKGKNDERKSKSSVVYRIGNKTNL